MMTHCYPLTWVKNTAFGSGIGIGNTSPVFIRYQIDTSTVIKETFSRTRLIIKKILLINFLTREEERNNTGIYTNPSVCGVTHSTWWAIVELSVHYCGGADIKARHNWITGWHQPLNLWYCAGFLCLCQQMQENTFRMEISCLMCSFMCREIGFSRCYFSPHSP